MFARKTKSKINWEVIEGKINIKRENDKAAITLDYHDGTKMIAKMKLISLEKLKKTKDFSNTIESLDIEKTIVSEWKTRLSKDTLIKYTNKPTRNAFIFTSNGNAEADYNKLMGIKIGGSEALIIIFSTDCDYFDELIDMQRIREHEANEAIQLKPGS